MEVMRNGATESYSPVGHMDSYASVQVITAAVYEYEIEVNTRQH